MKYILIFMLLFGFRTLTAQEYIWESVKSSGAFTTSFAVYDSNTFYDFVKGLSHKLSKTTDAGKTWEVLIDQPTRSGMMDGYYGLVAPTKDYVATCNDSGYIMYSKDVGKNWNKRKVGDTAMRSLSMCDDKNGVVIEEKVEGSNDDTTAHPYYLHITHDGWESSKKIKVLPPKEWWSQYLYLLYNVVCVTPSKILLFMQSGQSHGIATTNDGGENWEFEKEPIPIKTWVSTPYMFFIDSTNGWFCSTIKSNKKFLSYIARTRDGGRSWEKLFSDSAQGLNGSQTVAFQDSLNGIACGFENLMRTRDGGKTWASESIAGGHAPAGGYVAYPKGSYGVYSTAVGRVFVCRKNIMGVEHAEEQLNATISPNPARGRALLGMEQNSGGGVVLLYNTLGQEVQRVEFGNETNVSLDLSGLVAGCYNAVIKTKRGVAVKKIIVN